MDQWDIGEASRQFGLARDIRWTNLRESKNPFAVTYAFHCEHGLAMTDRYLGKVKSARDRYEGLVRKINGAILEAERQQARPGQQQYSQDLRERWSNSMERWADCELYEGAASAPDPVRLALAGQRYQKARAKVNEAGAQAALACKKCIVLAIQGGSSLDEAVKEFARPEVSRDAVAGPNHERVLLLREVAGATLALKQNTAEGRNKLRGFLDRIRLSPGYLDSRRRETLELQLFCAELLLSSELSAGDTVAAQKDLKHLDRLLSIFRGRSEMLPYLRRYYDLAIRAAGRGDPVQVAEYLLQSRTAAPGIGWERRRCCCFTWRRARKRVLPCFSRRRARWRFPARSSPWRSPANK